MTSIAHFLSTGATIGAIVWLAALPSVVAAADDTAVDGAPPAGDDSWEERTRRFLRTQLEGYQVASVEEPGAVFPLQREPLLRWENPVSGAQAGAVFVWMDGGRPIVIAKCHVNPLKSHWIETLTSLAAARVHARTPQGVMWSPAVSGVQSVQLPEAFDPRTTAAQRLVQMRSIARRVRAEGEWGEESVSRWQYRLLPSPLLRYAAPEQHIVDGALFAFVQGTNPEALLLVEAVKPPEAEPFWRLSAARMTRYAVEVFHQDQLLLSLPRSGNNQSDESTYHGYHPNTGHLFAREEAESADPKSVLPQP